MDTSYNRPTISRTGDFLRFYCTTFVLHQRILNTVDIPSAIDFSLRFALLVAVFPCCHLYLD